MYWDAAKGNLTAQNTRKPAERAYSAPANPLVGREGLAVPSPRTPSPALGPSGLVSSTPTQKLVPTPLHEWNNKRLTDDEIGRKWTRRFDTSRRVNLYLVYMVYFTEVQRKTSSTSARRNIKLISVRLSQLGPEADNFLITNIDSIKIQIRFLSRNITR